MLDNKILKYNELINNQIYDKMLDNLNKNMNLVIYSDNIIINKFCIKLYKEYIKNNNDFSKINKFLRYYLEIDKILDYFKNNCLNIKLICRNIVENPINFNSNDVYLKNESKISTKSKKSKKRLFFKMENWKNINYKSNKISYNFNCKWYTNSNIPFKKISILKNLLFTDKDFTNTKVIQDLLETDNNIIKGWIILDRNLPKDLIFDIEIQKKVLKYNLNETYTIYLFNHKNLNYYYSKLINVESKITSLSKILLFVISKKENMINFVFNKKEENISIFSVKSEKNNYYKLINDIDINLNNNEVDDDNDNNDENSTQYNFLNNFNYNYSNIENSNLEIFKKIIDILNKYSNYNILNNILLIFEDKLIINKIFNSTNIIKNRCNFNIDYWNLNKGKLNLIFKNLSKEFDKNFNKILINDIYNIAELGNKLIN